MLGNAHTTTLHDHTSDHGTNHTTNHTHTTKTACNTAVQREVKYSVHTLLVQQMQDTQPSSVQSKIVNVIMFFYRETR